MDSESRVYVAGNTGLVGSAIVRMLHWKGYTNILSSPSSHWDLRNQSDVERFFRVNEPEYVYLAAAKVGGIGAIHSRCEHGGPVDVRLQLSGRMVLAHGGVEEVIEEL